jgi:ADP-heptose:LPS heptosyltransferase
MASECFQDMTRVRMERVLVICLGGFGDTIMATPLFRALRMKYGDAHVCGLTMWKSSAAVLQHLGIFNDVIQHDFINAPTGQSLRVLWGLRKKQFDLSVLAFPTNRAHYNIVSWLIHARYRLGHDYLLGSSLAYCRFLLTHRIRQTKGTHNVCENIKLAQALGIRVDELRTDIGSLGTQETTWAQSMLGNRRPPYLGIHPGSSPLKNHTQRRWPVDKYAELACRFSFEVGGTAVVFLGPDEQDMEPMFRSVDPVPVILSGMSIERVACLVRRCDLLVCSDSSLGHMAAACSVPEVMILGPTNPDYIRPWGVPHRIVSQRLPCSPCFEISRRPLRCREGLDYVCVREIEVSTVLNSCRDLLDEIRGDRSTVTERQCDLSY